MFAARLTHLLSAASGLLIAALAGCADGNWGSKRDIPPEPPPKPRPAADNVLADTVGAYTLVGMGQPERLRGFGIVIGLGENGGSDCPTTIREYLLDYLAREMAPRDSAPFRPKYSAREMLDSLDTAVVAIHGLVPVGAPQGTRFDLQVEAVGTQTRSLAGGVLIPCELKRFDVAAEGKGLVSGRTLARARGLVFTSAEKPDAGPQDPHAQRRGYVLGGGKTLTDRNVRLMLQEPSYWTARKIERRINERFGQNPPVANAMSQGYLTLTTPPEFQDNPQRFLDLVTHLYLEITPARIEQKLQLLSRELDGSDETLNHVALVWEGLGRTVIPHIQALYEHASPAVRYYAARTGVRLKDVNALAPLARIAADPAHHCRLLATSDLGATDMPLAARRLAELLDDADNAVRIAAYEGLLNHPHPSVESRRFLSALDPTQINLTLDIVDSKAPPLIYVRRSLDPRIAVFGRDTSITLPLFYSHPRDLVTLNALEHQTEITLLWRSQSGAPGSEPLLLPPRVVELLDALGRPPNMSRRDKSPGGIGLNYARIVDLLQTLCEHGSIPAGLVLEEAPLADLLAPPERRERLETDHIEPAPQPAPAPESPAREVEFDTTEDTSWSRPE